MYNDIPVISIEYPAFYNASIESVTISSDVKSIGDYAFYNCNSLERVVIYDSLINIGRLAFYNCINLKSIEYYGTVQEWKSIIKDDHWDSQTDSYVVYCINGEITKDGVVTYY